MEQRQRLNGAAMDQAEDTDKSCLCWHRMPNSKRCLVVLIVLLVLVILFLLGLTVIMATREVTKPLNICVTRECMESAEALARSIDPAVDPCQDFYKFACGGFLKDFKNPPPGNPYYSAFTLLTDSAKQALKNVMESPGTATNSEAVIKMKETYSSCINTLGYETEDASWANIRGTLDEVGLRGWPRDLGGPVPPAAVMARMQAIGSDQLFTLTLGGNSKAQFYAYGLDAIEYQLFELAETKNYHYLSLRILKHFDAPRAEALADTIYQMHVELLELALSAKNTAFEDLKLSDLNRKYPSFDWSRFFQELFDFVGYEADVKERVLVMPKSDDYLEGLMNFTRKYSARDIKAYLGMELVVWASQFSGPAVRSLVESEKVQNNPKEYTLIDPVWKICVKNVYLHFQEAATAEYAKVMSNDEMLEEVRRYLERAKDTFIEHLPQNEWVNDVTKASIKAKINNFTIEIGYPRSMLNYDQLSEKYQTVEISPDNFLENHKNLKKLRILIEVKNLQSINNIEWNFNPMEINAYNSQQENKIVIPISILYPPFFQLQRPKYLNYGSMGFSVAHEMGHTFDIQGIQTTAFKWSQEMLATYMQRVSCIVNHYSSFTFNELDPPVQWDGNKSIKDDSADFVGLMHSFLAYQNYKKEHGEEPGLPGLNYTSDQLFYIQFANVMCTTYTPVVAQNVPNGDHSPGDVRTQAAVTTTPFFGKTFNCPEGSPMNPKEKCDLWK